ncbi:hypothetical protein [Bauldia litoralis]|uniref:Uncharacterized protein n=1 Tax=Bauldia litoralis TaxID=665467 RepID=A0A1G6DU57_9HYPH|nr:hypothetical protein [Bauldia litoralis]SDB48703.1 hypothetical protein SAMN02982931_03781 [Bauldia litoralis]
MPTPDETTIREVLKKIADEHAKYALEFVAPNKLWLFMQDIIAEIEKYPSEEGAVIIEMIKAKFEEDYPNFTPHNFDDDELAAPAQEAE